MVRFVCAWSEVVERQPRPLSSHSIISSPALCRTLSGALVHMSYCRFRRCGRRYSRKRNRKLYQSLAVLSCASLMNRRRKKRRRKDAYDRAGALLAKLNKLQGRGASQVNLHSVLPVGTLSYPLWSLT